MMRSLWRSAMVLLPAAAFACKGDEGPTGPDQETIDKLTITAQHHTPGFTPTIGTTALGLASPRDGWMYIPDGYNHNTPTPVIVLLHGAGSNANFFNDFKPTADLYDVILVSVESRYPTWDIVETEDYGPDVMFLNSVMEFLFDHANVDVDRISIAGFSDGGTEALGVGLANAGLFTRVAAFAPGYLAAPFSRGYPPVFIAHGNADQVISYANTQNGIVAPLRQQGFTVDFMLFDGGHTIPGEAIIKLFDKAVAQ